MLVGNDVVDLRDPDSHPATLHPRFDARVFGSGERRAIARAADPRAVRWSLWAAKEAAYKVARKRDAGVPFVPVRFRVELGALGTAEVTHGDRRFDVSIGFRDGAVHAVAREAGTQPSAFAAARRLPEPATPDALSRAARDLAREELGRRLGVAPEAVVIRRRARIPEVWVEGRRAAVDLSLSHHGRVVAFAALVAGARA